MYLWACTILMAVALITAAMRMHATRRRLAEERYPAALASSLMSTLTLLAALLVCAPVVSTVFSEALFQTGGVRMRSGTPTVALSIAGGVLALMLVLAQAYVSRTKVTFITTGVMVLTFLSAGLVTVAGIKHFQFVGPDSGMANFDFFRDQASDMRCSSGIILYTGASADLHTSGERPITYRCPTSYVLNPYTRSPFVPWPDFKDGESLELAKALAAFRAEAEAGSLTKGSSPNPRRVGRAW